MTGLDTTKHFWAKPGGLLAEPGGQTGGLLADFFEIRRPRIVSVEILALYIMEGRDMKLTPLDTEIETPKGTRYLVPRRRLLPVRDLRGRTHYYLRKLPVVLPRCLNWLGRRLTKR